SHLAHGQPWSTEVRGRRGGLHPGRRVAALPMQRIVGTVAWWAPRCQLAESPRWHDGRWWWIDVPAGLVYVASAGGETDGAARVWLRVRGRVSLVHPAGPGSLLVAHGPVL